MVQQRVRRNEDEHGRRKKDIKKGAALYSKVFMADDTFYDLGSGYGYFYIISSYFDRTGS